MLFLLNLGSFIQNQILKMKWLSQLIIFLLDNLGISQNTKIGNSIHFFIYDVIKITLLLCIMIFFISYLQTYFPAERSKKILLKFNGLLGNIVAALLGTVTPFCSCSSIPLFIGFINSGLPLGTTFSFLISSPMVDLGSLILLISIFGIKIAMAYVFLGLIIAIISGIIIEKLHLEDELENFVPASIDISSTISMNLTRKERLNISKITVKETISKVFFYIVIGVGIGAIIHNWIPNFFVEKILGINNPFGVIFATLLGIPIYADIFGTIPIAEVLLNKGAMLGTILAFMMGVTTLSLPSIIMLRKVMRPKLLIIFISITCTGIIIVGYIFNFFQYFLF